MRLGWTTRWLLVVALFAAACAGSDPVAGEAAEEPAPTIAPSATPEARSTPTAEVESAAPAPTPTSPPLPPTAVPATSDGGSTAGSSLGAYVVAREDAGDAYLAGTLGSFGAPARIIPVYDEPDGSRRTLLEVNAIDGVAIPLPLFGWDEQGSPTVLRLLDGEPGDDWFLVQAPTRPHNTSVWVSAEDFEWASTTRRVEINLSGPGELTVWDGDEVLMTTDIVQGRDVRPTPEHVTFLEAGVLGEFFRGPAYGHAILMIASYSESLGTFGGGGSPQNFIHGTNQPSLMGQRVSSGEIRLTDEAIAELVELVHPGTPVLLFRGDGGRDRILAAGISPAETTTFAGNAVGSNATSRAHPQLWERCETPRLVCLNPSSDVTLPFLYAVAADPLDTAQIPVYNEPFGPPGTLLDRNYVDGLTLPYPLYATTPFGQPLVLRVLQTSADGNWLRVQVPVRPNGSTAWVRAEDFVVESTTIRVEISTARFAQNHAGRLMVLDGTQVLVDVPIASGRESRPTALGSGWVGQIVAGADLSPAYGTWVLDIGIHSEALGTFGGGGIPRHAIRGTNQPDTVGQRVTSGSPRLRNLDVEAIVRIEGILGAPVTIRDVPLTEAVLRLGPGVPSTPALIGGWLPDAEALIPSFA
ncbi:MAG: L,D-transpeptidase [Actinomycetota bacterium]